MPVRVKRTDVAPMIQNRRHGGGMYVGHMVDLGIGLHRDLPITVQVKALLAHQATVFKLEFCPLVGNWP